MNTPKKTTLDRAKMEHVILFFLERINNLTLGRTKLMKLLYFVDFDHFEKHGRPITFAKYRKLPHGPVPDKADEIIKDMETRGDVRKVQGRAGDFVQQRLLTAKAKFDPAVFSGDELQTLELVAAQWVDATAKEIESATHKEAPWAATENGKAIDYEMALYRAPCPEEGIDAWLAQSKPFHDLVSKLA